MFKGHDPYLVALSVVIAILGGYTGFGLAAGLRSAPGANRRLLISGAAGFLAIGIWTMHFIGMLAAPLPVDTAYRVLPTVVSFLICVLVVGVSVFFVSIGAASRLRVVTAALLLGIGVASMHYVGIHGLSGDFHIEHDPVMVGLAVLIAVGTAYGGLRIFLARQGGLRLALSAVAFGLAVSGMHYTAMYGMQFRFAHESTPTIGGFVVSIHVLSVVVAVLCFLTAAAFLLFLVPDPRGRQAETDPEVGTAPLPQTAMPQAAVTPEAVPPLAAATPAASPAARVAPALPAGLGEAAALQPVSRLPVEGADGTHFIDIAEIRSVKADAHYTRVHDGARERLSSLSISQVEAQLDRSLFLRVHRSHIVALSHVAFIRKEGDGAVVGLDGPASHEVPVSRGKIAQLKVQLGLAKRHYRSG